MDWKHLVVLCLFLLSVGFNIGAVYAKHSLYDGMNWGSIALSILTIGAFIVLFNNPENKKLYFGGVIVYILTFVVLYGKKEWGKIKAIRFSVIGMQAVSLAVCLYSTDSGVVGEIYGKGEYENVIKGMQRGSIDDEGEDDEEERAIQARLKALEN